MNKVKYYRDPKRAQQSAYVPYVPQYKVHGFEPLHMTPAAVPIEHQTPQQQQGPLVTHVISTRQSKAKPVSVVRKNVPYASVPDALTPLGPMPNIGNNIETSWASVNDEIIDDLDEGMGSLDPNHPMIDNNDDDTVNYRNIPAALAPPEQSQLIEDELEVVEQSEPLLNINNNDYVLVVAGSILAIGDSDVIESEVRKLVFGEHELCKTHNITQDDIIVLKRVKIKVGVFIE